MQYESTRHNFNKLLESYKNYVALYKLFNNGSTRGVTPFGVFYMRFTYYVRYESTTPENLTRGF